MKTESIYFILYFGVPFFGLLFFGLYWAMKREVETYALIKNIKEKAKNAKTKEELSLCYNELIEVNKRCWNKSMAIDILEVKAIIETKYSML